jgi:quinol-cytochrome oxidoreductase complex cytochrome b subunit
MPQPHRSVPIVGMLRICLGYGRQTLPVLHPARQVLPSSSFCSSGFTSVQPSGRLFRFESEKDAEQKPFNFWPDHAYTEILIGLVLMILLSTLATVLPVTMGPKADPLVTPEVIKPEWFFYVAFRWLKLFSGTFAILSTGFIVFMMFAWPFIDAWIRRRTRFTEASVWIGIFAVTSIIGLVWRPAEH